MRGLFEKEEREAWGGRVEEGRGEVRVTMWVAGDGITSSQLGSLERGGNNC